MGRDIKKVEIRLTPLKIKEDPNVIFDMMEENQASKFRVQKVVEEIVKMQKEASPQTRLNASKDESIIEVAPAEVVSGDKAKKSAKTKAAPKSAKKTDASPTLKPRGRKAAAKVCEPVTMVEIEAIEKKKPVKVTKEVTEAVKIVEKESKKPKVASKISKTVEKETRKTKAAPKESKPSKTGL